MPTTTREKNASNWSQLRLIGIDDNNNHNVREHYASTSSSSSNSNIQILFDTEDLLSCSCGFSSPVFFFFLLVLFLVRVSLGTHGKTHTQKTYRNWWILVVFSRILSEHTMDNVCNHSRRHRTYTKTVDQIKLRAEQNSQQNVKCSLNE